MKKILLAVFVAAAALTSCNNGSPKANLKTDIDTLSYEMGMTMGPTAEELASYLAQSGSDSAYVDDFIKGFIDGLKAADDKKKLAYNMGMQIGMQTKNQMPQYEAQFFQGDSTKRISVKNFAAGFSAMARNKSNLKIGGKVVDKKTAQERVMDYIYGGLKRENQAFMQKIAKTPGMKALGEGVYGKELSKGSDKHVAATDSVVISYEGRLAIYAFAKCFHARSFGNLLHKGLVLALKTTKGWQIAVPQMTVGSTWEVYIPYNLGYGETGTGPIPPYATLIFKITLVK